MNDQLELEFEHVTKSFTGDRVVVNNLSFSVKKGEFFSFLGPSGCGKTTCLRMISGLERPSQGLIKMSGKVVNDIHPHKRNVHTVFQKYALFPHLNVFENVAFGLKMKKRPPAEVKERVERMLRMVSLQDYTRRSIQQLSGGEQQRVALVRALVNEPAILLLDEPLAALDLKLREQMHRELSSLQKQLGTTFIFVTHDQGEALTLSDRVAIMNAGNIEQIGTPTEVYEQPASTFVARFVGTTNVFSGPASHATIGGGGSGVAVATDGFGTLFAKQDEAKPRPATGDNVGLVVRPEKIRIRVTAPAGSGHGGLGTQSSTSSAPAPASAVTPANGASAATAVPTDAPIPSGHTVNVLRGTLIERIYFGPTTQIKLQISDRLPPIIALVANQTATKMPSLKMGDRYYAVWDAADSILVSSSQPTASQST
ncbi:MAG: ATP-binding cassette domain-containing protein [Deltaproteobacteria bacterium]|nr:ATP-binding cassette domain-containing protein [Deltaproteobacteria bacterium]